MTHHNNSAGNHFLPLNFSISLGLLLAVSLSACQPANEVTGHATASNDTSSSELKASQKMKS